MIPAERHPEPIEPYGLFLRCLEPPSAPQLALLRHPELSGWLARLARMLGEPPPPDLEPPPSLESLESTYIALFDAAFPMPPVPLIASHYTRRDPVPRVLHEHVLFYQAFGLRLRDDNGESADHLLNELEFLAHLSRLQDAAPHPGRAYPIRLAKRDFLERHTAAWLPSAAAAAERCAPALYAALLRLLAAWTRHDLRRQNEWLVRCAPGAGEEG